jgi:mannose-6-phosphate isomerase-like protein (cupin superfamily)
VKFVAIEPGDAVYIPPNAIQFLHNYGDEPIAFVCLVDPAWRKEDETIYAPEIEATASL